MPSYKVISSDSHTFEPRDLWTSRAEPRFRDRVMHIESREDGSDWWLCDGLLINYMGPGTQVGRRFEEPERLTMTSKFEDVRPGGYIPEERIKDMDEDGIDVDIVYPTASLPLFKLPDSELLSAQFRIYNDWVAEFCKPFPDRLEAIAMINVDDVHEGVQELERCAKMGLAGGMITVSPPEGRAYNSPDYEPLWAAAQDLEMPISLHVGTARPDPRQGLVTIEEASEASTSNSDYLVRMSIGHMIFSGVFERYPKLRVGSVEQELSWIPHFLQAMDFTYSQRAPRPGWRRFKGDTRPSDYWHSNIFASFQEDGLGIKLRDIIGGGQSQVGSYLVGLRLSSHRVNLPQEPANPRGDPG